MIIDVREERLSALLPLEQKKQLPIADIWIGCSEDGEPQKGSVLIERKTVADFEASILDGRYREQRTRLLSYCSQTGSKPLYILEGTMDSMQQKRLEKQALQKLLNRLTLRYGISVLTTANLQETAWLLGIIEEQWKDDHLVFQGEIVSYAETLSVHKKKNRTDVLMEAMLQQCPGVSAKVAIALAGHFKNLCGLLAATEEEIANVMVGEKRRVGPAVAKRLLQGCKG